MNVTSLLNLGQSRQERSEKNEGSPNHSSSAGTTASTAVHTPTPTPSPETAPPQSKMAHSRSPPKMSRTPWEGDHGNPFSLPINLAVDTKTTPIATTGFDLWNVSPVDVPRQPSPKLHKFSDSIGSSLSSYTSSSTSSLSHSRISSLSTVEESMSWPLSDILTGAAPGPREKPEEEPSSPTPIQPGHAAPPPADTGQTYTANTQTGHAGTVFTNFGAGDFGHMVSGHPVGHAEVKHSGNGSGDFEHVVTSHNGAAQSNIGWISQSIDTGPPREDESGSGEGEDQGDESQEEEDQEEENQEEEDQEEGEGGGQTAADPVDPAHHFSNEQPSNGNGNGQAITATLGAGQQYAYEDSRGGQNNGSTDTRLLDTARQFSYGQHGDGNDNGPGGNGPFYKAQQFGHDQPGNGHADTGPWSAVQQFSRPLSPSDVVMIKRGAGEGSFTGTTPNTTPIEPQRSAELWYPGQTEASTSRTHKRAVSAPDFAAMRGRDLGTASGRDVATTFGRQMPSADARGTQYADGREVESSYDKESTYGSWKVISNPGHLRLQTIHEPTNPGPQEQVPRAQDNEAESDEDGYYNKKVALTLAPSSVLDNLDAEPRCMFVRDCKTGSQLRKAISHIFGRNKICTRQIPDTVWVHFCRKHYQRCRYRNVQEYAKLQCQLIIKQIQRVQAWSDRNQARNELGVVSAWSLSIRKREQRRRQMKKAGYDGIGKKRPYPGYDSIQAVEAEEAEDENRYKDPHAVPDWLIEKCDRDYKTDEVINIFKRIEQELNDDKLRQVPDIEVLPNITHDPNVEPQYKRYEKRKHMEVALEHLGHHRRVQSTGSQGYGFGRAPGLPSPSDGSYWSKEPSPTPGYHVENLKRQRVSDRLDDPHVQTWTPPMPPRSESRTVPRIWRPGTSTGSYLPAPVAQRSNTRPAVQQLESSTIGFGDFPRPSHQRSQSDAGSLRQLPPVGFDTPGSRFTSLNTANLPTPGYSQRSSTSYYHQDPARHGSNLPGAQQIQGGAYGSGSNIQHHPGQTPGNGAASQPYSGNTYSIDTTRQPSGYDDGSARQQQTYVGTTSYYQQPAAAAPPPMAARQGHARHQSTPVISQTAQQMYGPSSGFHSTVVPEGYPPGNQAYGQEHQQSFATGQAGEDLGQ